MVVNGSLQLECIRAVLAWLIDFVDLPTSAFNAPLYRLFDLPTLSKLLIVRFVRYSVNLSLT